VPGTAAGYTTGYSSDGSLVVWEACENNEMVALIAIFDYMTGHKIVNAVETAFYQFADRAQNCLVQIGAIAESSQHSENVVVVVGMVAPLLPLPQLTVVLLWWIEAGVVAGAIGQQEQQPVSLMQIHCPQKNL